jgi:hypothetical protein
LSVPVIADLGQNCGGRAEERDVVWGDRRDTGASLDFLVESLEAVGRAEASPVAGRDTEDREGLRRIRLDLLGELRPPPPVSPGDILEPPLSLGLVISVEDASEVGRDFHPHVHLGGVGHRVPHDGKCGIAAMACRAARLP